MNNGICPFAIWCPGPPEKTGYSGKDKTHAKVGVVLHTMEYESTPEWNDATTLHNALFSGREASWTFSICKFMNGSILYQHYPLDAVTWHAGYQGNLWLIGIETEGIAPGKFTEPQYALLLKLLRWVAGEHGWANTWRVYEKGQVFIDDPLQPVVMEHNSVPGAPPTNCQVFTRGQVDPERLLRDLKEEPMDWPGAKIDLLNDFLEWWHEFPESQKEKDDSLRQARENQAYSRFYKAQIGWRGPGT